MSNVHDHVAISYLCSECGRTRNLNIDKDVHLNRRELTINGLASYIDVHADKNGKARHGQRIFIDKNFHVRTNNVLKVKEASPSVKKTSSGIIPTPGFKTKNLTTKYPWDSWSYLELDLKAEGLKFILELEKPEEKNIIGSRITTVSELGSVVCNLDAIVKDNAPEVIEYITQWMSSFCNSLELAASIHVDLIPEILRYIDHHVLRRPTFTDNLVIQILIDKASVLIPDKHTMNMISEHGPGMELIGLDQEKLKKIALKLGGFEKIVMVDIQKILVEELEKDKALEEEFIVLALFYLISMDAFDYRLSYLTKEE